jgi:rhamnosyltransferase
MLICAIITTYYPQDIVATVASIVDQVSKVLIVDNGRLDNRVFDILPEKCLTKLHIIVNDRNYGIATALNQGIAYARENGFDWILTLDQDTTCFPDMVSNLVEVLYCYYDKHKIAIIGTNYTEKNINTTAVYKKKHVIEHDLYYELDEVITSGSFLSLEVVSSAGMFRDDYFIYYVDHEYCARLRLNGYKILLTKKIGMSHSTGECKLIKLLGMRLVQLNYSPFKHYYIVRNCIIMSKTYYRKFPIWAFRMLFSMVKRVIKTIIFENNKTSNMKYILKGFCHGLNGTTGELNLKAKIKAH